MLANQLGIERLLVVVNSQSAHFDKVERGVIDVLDQSEWAAHYDVFETRKPTPGQPTNTERISKLREPNQGLVLAAGDGTVFDAVNSSDQVEDEIRASTHHIVLAYGGGNDAARSCHGRKGRADLIDLLDHGVVREVDLIDVLVGEERKVAISYVGLGWTALGSEAINKPEKRRQKKAHPRISHKVFDGITLSQLIVAEHFRPSFKYSENSEGLIEASEMLFSNLPSMAGGVIQVEKSQPGKVVCIEISPDIFVPDVLKRLATQKIIGGMKGTHITDRTIVVEPGTVIHLDGEAQRLEERTTVSVGVKPDRVKVLVKAA